MFLSDFEPLSRAERLLLEAFGSGGIARVGYRRPQSPSSDVTLRAEFLAFLAHGGSASAPGAGRRIELLGAWVTGRFSLQGAAVPVSLWMFRCVFESTPLLDGARITGSVGFPDCALPGLRAEACRIAGGLSLNSGCVVSGEVRLSRATIARDLNCDRGRFGSGDTPAPGRQPLVADGACIGGDVRIGDGLEAHGEVRLVGARIDGDLHAAGARLNGCVDADGARQVALNLDRIRVAGDVVLDGGFSAAGSVRMERARVAGSVDASGAAFDIVGDATWSDGAALRLDGARIDGSLFLRRLQTPLLGASLVGTRVGELVDDASTWGQLQVLDGFRYARLGPGAPLDARFRLGWLARQKPAHLDADFRPQPWRQAIKVMRRMGHDSSARGIAIGREAQLHRIGRIGAGLPRAWRWIPRLGHRLFGLVAGYGHRPLRLLGCMAVMWLGCALLYQMCLDHGAMAPVHPLLFSLERLLPMLDLMQPHGAVVAPVDGADPWAELLHAVVVTEVLLGWAASLTLLAMIAGWTDRDARR
jgi:hypothetical protein